MNNKIPNIWQMQTDSDTEGLSKALRHESPNIRRRAAAALRIIGKSNVIDDLEQALQAEQDSNVQHAIHAAIDHLSLQETQTEEKPTQTRVERLIEQLMGNQADLSIKAANALGELNDKTSVAPLISLFRNQRRDPQVRLAAAETLLKMDSAPAEVTLLAALRSEKATLRRNGAAILGQLQAEWAVSPLADALSDENDVVAKTARAALRRIGTPDARKALQDAKRTILETGVLDAQKLQRAKKTANEQLSKNITLPSPPKIENIIEKQQKLETAKLKPPVKKTGTATLKQVISALNNMETAKLSPKPEQPAVNGDLHTAETKKLTPPTDELSTTLSQKSKGQHNKKPDQQSSDD